MPQVNLTLRDGSTLSYNALEEDVNSHWQDVLMRGVELFNIYSDDVVDATVTYNDDDEPEQTNIDRGMAYLDSVDPGWEHRVDLDKLDMSNYDYCVVGQSQQGHYDEVMEAWGLDRNAQVNHGFWLDDATDWEWEQHTEAWKEAIKGRCTP